MRIFRFIVIVSFLHLCWVSASTASESEALAANSPGSNQPSTVAAISVATIGVLALGAGIFFGARYLKKTRDERDSIVTTMEKKKSLAEKQYSERDYSSARETYQSMLNGWNRYARYYKKNMSSAKVQLDIVKKRHSDCKFLAELAPFIIEAENAADSLPSNEDLLVEKDRHDVLSVMRKYRTGIDSLITKYPSREGLIREGFKKVITAFTLRDTLFSHVYDQQKLDFSLKSKYYYNHAVQSKDSSNLRHFVDDCDYYQIDKEWCVRARMSLEPPPIVNANTTDTVKSVNLKKAHIDTMALEYDNAIHSKNIDQLESYIKKYSSRKYRNKNTRVASVKTVVDSLKKTIQVEVNYNKLHPAFSSVKVGEIQFVTRGLDSLSESFFRKTLDSTEGNFRSIPGLRLPSLLMLDYTVNPPIIMMAAYLNYSRDINKTQTDSAAFYNLRGVQEAMGFLYKIKKGAINFVNMQKSLSAENVDNETTKLNSAVYVLRLRKSDNDYVTFYSKDKQVNSDKESDDFSFFDFYDITTGAYKDVRFTNSQQGVIKVPLIVTKGDSLRSVLTRTIFESTR